MTTLAWSGTCTVVELDAVDVDDCADDNADAGDNDDDGDSKDGDEKRRASPWTQRLLWIPVLLPVKINDE